MSSDNQAKEENKKSTFKLDAALLGMVKVGGSDLHLTVEAPPKIRLNGNLMSIGKIKLTEDVLSNALMGIINDRQRKDFEEEHELDFAYEVGESARFRVNYFVQKGNVGAVFRHISTNIKNLDELHMPSQVANIAELPRGLALVTGPTGSGKSTTLAAVVDLINRKRACHIMTIEDPIEYIHHHKKALVNQRQIGSDSWSFAEALKHVLRQDPDVILVGEMRDLETISIALTAAETGHLVLATLHTQSAVESVNRMVDVFPPSQQAQIRTQLATTLQAVVCQALLPTINGKSRVAATEIMFVNPAISHMIRDDKAYQIYNSLQGGKKEGMHSMDQSLADLVNSRIISYSIALEAVHDKKAFDLLVEPSLRNDRPNESSKWAIQ